MWCLENDIFTDSSQCFITFRRFRCRFALFRVPVDFTVNESECADPTDRCLSDCSRRRRLMIDRDPCWPFQTATRVDPFRPRPIAYTLAISLRTSPKMLLRSYWIRKVIPGLMHCSTFRMSSVFDAWQTFITLFGILASLFCAVLITIVKVFLLKTFEIIAKVVVRKGLTVDCTQHIMNASARFCCGTARLCSLIMWSAPVAVPVDIQLIVGTKYRISIADHVVVLFAAFELIPISGNTLLFPLMKGSWWPLMTAFVALNCRRFYFWHVYIAQSMLLS